MLLINPDMQTHPRQRLFAQVSNGGKAPCRKARGGGDRRSARQCVYLGDIISRSSSPRQGVLGLTVALSRPQQSAAASDHHVLGFRLAPASPANEHPRRPSSRIARGCTQASLITWRHSIEHLRPVHPPPRQSSDQPRWSTQDKVGNARHRQDGCILEKHTRASTWHEINRPYNKGPVNHRPLRAFTETSVSPRRWLRARFNSATGALFTSAAEPRTLAFHC